MAFRSKLARYNTVCCEQVMPVPVIPICAISCCLPQPICQVPPTPLPPPSPCNPPQAAIDAAPTELTFNPIKIVNYCPTIPPQWPGNILTNTTGSVPDGYLLCDGAEVSRTTYNALFLAIGTYYGDGNGTTTFNLPNLAPENSNCVLMYIIKT